MNPFFLFPSAREEKQSKAAKIAALQIAPAHDVTSLALSSAGGSS
jgi:hypothetical protein